MFEYDYEALEVIEAAGGREFKNGVIIVPRKAWEDPEVREALDYLVDEWDYAFGVE